MHPHFEAQSVLESLTFLCLNTAEIDASTAELLATAEQAWIPVIATAHKKLAGTTNPPADPLETTTNPPAAYLEQTILPPISTPSPASNNPAKPILGRKATPFLNPSPQKPLVRPRSAQRTGQQR